jgi:hypothetical protein
LRRRARSRTAQVLQREAPQVYEAVCEKLREGVLAADIARTTGVARQTIQSLRRRLYGDEDAARVRQLAARDARRAQGAALAELQKRLETPRGMGTRDLVSAVRSLGESARADEGSARGGMLGDQPEVDAEEVLVLYRRRAGKGQAGQPGPDGQATLSKEDAGAGGVMEGTVVREQEGVEA